MADKTIEFKLAVAIQKALQDQRIPDHYHAGIMVTATQYIKQVPEWKEIMDKEKKLNMLEDQVISAIIKGLNNVGILPTGYAYASVFDEIIKIPEIHDVINKKQQLNEIEEAFVKAQENKPNTYVTPVQGLPDDIENRMEHAMNIWSKINTGNKSLVSAVSSIMKQCQCRCGKATFPDNLPGEMMGYPVKLLCDECAEKTGLTKKDSKYVLGNLA